MIVVVDTNVWISALLFSRAGSIPERALMRAVRADVIATSVEMRGEIARILEEKGRWSHERIAGLLDRYLLNAYTMQLAGTVRICRDPKDNMFLECASLARAEVLVSGDKDLLAIKNYRGIRIMRAAEYLALPQ